MAAQTLVEAGVKVTMLDVGVTDAKYASLVPDADFLSLRRTDAEQHRYFLGDDFEALSWGEMKTGAQLTAPRKFMATLVERFLPILSESFSPLESLALGGLGNGWGIGCNVFSPHELAACGFDAHIMAEAYRVVARRIGVSATRDDATPYTYQDYGFRYLDRAVAWARDHGRYVMLDFHGVPGCQSPCSSADSSPSR